MKRKLKLRSQRNSENSGGRLFLVHVDGSGTELLSSQTMEEVLYQAHSDPAAVLLKEPLPDSQGAFDLFVRCSSHAVNGAPVGMIWP